MFPNGEKQLFITCQEGEWQVENAEWEVIPDCERKDGFSYLLLPTFSLLFLVHFCHVLIDVAGQYLVTKDHITTCNQPYNTIASIELAACVTETIISQMK
jgi:hypothetical protein